MANHKSAVKRDRQSKKRYLRNKTRKTMLKSITQKLETAVENNATEEAQATLKQAQKMIDQVADKGTIHKKTAARKVSRLTRLVGSIG